MSNKKPCAAVIRALLAAVFYAVCTPFSKLLLNYISPAFSAAFLYLGAGIGISILYLFRKEKNTLPLRLTKSDMPYTVGMILLDIAAPVCLMYGIKMSSASEASLLGNFEIVATALIAAIFFKEKISAKLWLAIGLITAAGIALSFTGAEGIAFSPGSALVLSSACLWGLENNCTRKISGKSTYEIVILKGFCSGAGSLIIAFLSGEKITSPEYIPVVLFLGFVSYGLSIFLYVRAQCKLGAAQTSAYYAAAPFISTFLCFIVNGETPDNAFFAGLALMAAGTAFAVHNTLTRLTDKSA